MSVAVLKADRSLSKWTPVVLVWALAAVWWSIFTPPEKTYIARIILLQPLWLVRVRNGDSTWKQDLGLALSLHALYTLWIGMWRVPSVDDIRSIDIRHDVTQIYLFFLSLLGACGVLAGAIVHRGHQLKTSETSSREPLRKQGIDEQLIPPLLIPSKTTHSRMFPKKHSFAYSYFLAGVPVGLQGCMGSALSVDSNRKCWFDVRAGDYLNRSDDHDTLAGKLQAYLHTQGITNRDYSFAYLVTAPRFLGYGFNPVSFWYLYDSDARLKHMILEVNNTFDERRLYMLKGDPGKSDSAVNLPEQLVGDSEREPRRLIFSETWDKDFHVSPFNSRQGSYSLRAVDPLASHLESGQFQIDNTIVLRSSKESAKIVARVMSRGAPDDAANISNLRLARLIAGWWWVGFATFPRIVWEARKLYFARKLNVWFRPEVADSSIGRVYNTDERMLEAFFKTFLENVVEHASRPLRLIYHAAHDEGEEVALYSPGFTYQEDRKRTLTVKVLTPAFYSRFVHYAHAREAFDRECLATHEKNKTVLIDNSALLPVFLDAVSAFVKDERGPTRRLGPVAQVRWAFLRRLRCPPPAQSYTTNDSNSDSAFTITDVRSFGFSELDTFAMRYCRDAHVYCRTAMKLFLSTRLAFGLEPVVEMLDMVLRAALLLVAMVYCRHTAHFDVLRPEKMGEEGIAEVVLTLLLANLVHVWEVVKG